MEPKFGMNRSNGAIFEALPSPLPREAAFGVQPALWGEQEDSGPHRGAAEVKSLCELPQMHVGGSLELC